MEHRTDPARPRIDAYLAEARLASSRPRVVPLTGDASDRRYFRVLVAGEPSIVLALHAGPIEYDTMPFVNVWHLLKTIPLPIPDILGHSDPLGILALQDLGDVTLQAHLGTAAPAEHTALYREAVSFIAQIQRRGAEISPGPYIPFTVAFDVEKLGWELQFFVKHFLEAYRGVSLAPAEREALVGEMAPIIEDLAAEPRVLCHRDYHSRNLMVHEGRLFVIDFQDARLGPDTYDLVSLLRDSYMDVPESTVDDLVGYFLTLKGGPAGVEATREFRRRFDVMALQRNLKALGTFGYQASARGNTVYIQYIPRTLACVRENLARQGRFSRLRDILAAHVPELR